jgi:hypothetical protein
MKYVTLTKIVRGFRPNKFISDKILPLIMVDGSPLKLKTFGKEMFKLYQTLRAKYADSNILRVEPGGELLVELKVRDAVGLIDKEYEATKELKELEIRAAKKGQEAILLNLEVINAAMIQDAASYPTGNKITLSGTDQWNDYTNSTPVKDVYDGKQAVSSKIGEEPNTMVLPKDVFDVIIWHPELKTVHPVTGQSQPATLETLKARFGIDNILLGNSKKLDEANDVFESIWTKDVELLYVNPNPNPNEEDVSFGYRFRQKGYPYVDDYEANKGKVEGRRSNDKVSDVILGSSAGYIIKAAIA